MTLGQGTANMRTASLAQLGTQGVTYRIECTTCKEEGVAVSYIGESARTMYDRGAEHLDAWRREDEASVLVEHQEQKHSPEERPRYSMKLIGTQKRPLYRQITESILIEEYKGELLNRKGEWGCNLPPTLEVDGSNENNKRGRDKQHEGRKENGAGGYAGG